MDRIDLAGAYLAGVGFFPQHSGFLYLASAIAAVSEDPQPFYLGKVSITGLIHARFGVTEAAARRCMDYAIRAAWESQTCDLKSAFGSDYPPTVQEFVYRLAVELAEQLNGNKPCPGQDNRRARISGALKAAFRACILPVSASAARCPNCAYKRDVLRQGADLKILQ